MKRFILSVFLLIFSAGDVAAQPLPPDRVNSHTIFGLMDTSVPGMERVGDALGRKDYHAAAEAYLDFRRKASNVKWKVEPVPPPAASSDKTDPWADSICMNYIKDNVNPKPHIQGAFFMGVDFDWLANPRTPDDPAHSREWTVAVVGRMKFIQDLSSFYRQTLNEKYVRKIGWLYDDFLRDHPISAYSGKGASSPLWRTLDVSIRGNSILNTYFTIRDSPAFTPSDQTNIATLVYLHASRLCTVLLADTVRSGNWVTTECNGLFNLGVMFPEFREAALWRNTAVERFAYEIARVVPPDGLQAELSPSYHYGTISAYSTIFETAKKNDIPLPEGFESRLVDMYRAPVLLMDQEGGFVRTNDSNPRYVRLESKRGYDLTGDPMLAWAASRGIKGLQPPTSTMLSYAGFYMMRSDWNRGGLFLFFRAGPEGIAHAEQDMLQVVLKAWGQTLLFDPGKYNYDRSQWRRYAINTAAHNTIIVDGKWQNREKKPLAKFTPVDNPWISTPLFDYVSGCYDKGYETNIYDPTEDYRPQKWAGDRDTSVVHTRRVIYLKPYYALVLDELTGYGSHTYDAHFHIDAPSAVVDGSTQAVFSRRDDDAQIALYPLERHALETEVVTGQKDPMLGWMPNEHRPTPTARFRKTQSTPACFATFLYPYRKQMPDFSFTTLSAFGGDVRAYRIDTGKERCDIFISRTGDPVSIRGTVSSSEGLLDASANVLMVRRPESSRNVYIGGWNVTRYSDNQLSFTASEDSHLVVVSGREGIYVHNSGTLPMEINVQKPFRVNGIVMPGKWNGINAGGMREATEPVLFPLFNTDGDR